MGSNFLFIFFIYGSYQTSISCNTKKISIYSPLWLILQSQTQNGSKGKNTAGSRPVWVHSQTLEEACAVLNQHILTTDCSPGFTDQSCTNSCINSLLFLVIWIKCSFWFSSSSLQNKTSQKCFQEFYFTQSWQFPGSSSCCLCKAVWRSGPWCLVIAEDQNPESEGTC